MENYNIELSSEEINAITMSLITRVQRIERLLETFDPIVDKDISATYGYEKEQLETLHQKLMYEKYK
jgi:hypothetical protein